MPPSFSVVVPTVHRPRLLDEALSSILDQTLPPAEVIVVVDDPEDSRGEAARIAERYPGVRVLLGEGRGDGLARYMGYQQATAEWVCFLDDDDLWASDKLALQARHIDGHQGCLAVRGTFWIFATEQSGPEWLYGFRRDFVACDLGELNSHAKEHPPSNDFQYLDIYGRSLELMLERNRGVISTSAIRRDVLARVPQPPADLAAGADWILLTDVAAHAEWCLQPEGMAFYRLHSGQQTASPRVPVDTVRAMLTLWQHHQANAPRPLISYSALYRQRLQELAWSSLRRGRVAAAARVLAEGRPLLGRAGDQVRSWVPYPIDARLARLGTAAQLVRGHR